MPARVMVSLRLANWSATNLVKSSPASQAAVPVTRVTDATPSASSHSPATMVGFATMFGAFREVVDYQASSFATLVLICSAVGGSILWWFLVTAITGIFQGMLLFFLLGSDVFIDNRLRRSA